MRKLLSLMLIVLLVFSLFGCSGSKDFTLTIDNRENGFKVQTFNLGDEIDPYKYAEENEDAHFIPRTIPDGIKLDYKLIQTLSVGNVKGSVHLREKDESDKYTICGYTLAGEGSLCGVKLREDAEKVFEKYKDIKEFEDVIPDFDNSIYVVYVDKKVMSIDEFNNTVYLELKKEKTPEELTEYLNGVVVVAYRFHNNVVSGVYLGDYNFMVHKR